MPTYPSHLSIAPLLDITQSPGEEDTPPATLSQQVISLEEQLVIFLTLTFFFVWFNSRYCVKLSLKIALSWAHVAQENDATPSPPSVGSSPSMLHVPPPADPFSGQQVPDNVSDPSSDLSYQEPEIREEPPAHIPSPELVPTRLNTPVPTPISASLAPSGPRAPSILTAHPERAVIPLPRRRALDYPSDVSAPSGSNQTPDAPNRPSSFSPLLPPPIVQPSEAERNWTYERLNQSFADRRTRLPTPLDLGPDMEDPRLAFIVDVSWVQFLRLIGRHSTQDRPMYLDLVENTLVTYLCHRNAYPNTHDPNPWLTLAQFHDRIVYRMGNQDTSPPLLQMLFDALPRAAFPGGVRSSQAPIPEGRRGEMVYPDPIDTHHRSLYHPEFHHGNAIFTLPDPARLSDVLDRVDADLVRHR